MRSLNRAARITAVLSVAVLGGCGETRSTDPGSPATTDAPLQVSPPIAVAADPDIRVTTADRAAYDEVIEKHRGKVVLVDFWATWCPPCVAEFPHTVAIAERADAAGLAIVSVSMDEPEDESKVLKFLQRQNANFENLLSSYGVGQEGFEAFEITDGSIPHYKIYGRTGKLRHSASGNEGLDEVVEKLLAE